ncbi:Gfo/Idh/MocA family protein [Paenibacillus thalictri]|nr:Gfo/Idh/MocA family oxidoreductase [Paenibacillus thalictri]
MNKSWQDLRVLIAGCGSIGRRHAEVLHGLGVRDLLACDPAPEQLAGLISGTPSVAACASFEEGLERRPDAVYILSPTRLHIPMAKQAMQAGAHVFMEKPLSDTMEGVDEFERFADEAGKAVMVGLCFRFHAGIVQAKKWVEQGRIGRVVSVRAMMGEHFPDIRPDYKSTYYAKYSGAFELMHDLDLAIWFAGQSVKQVHAVYGSFSDIGIEAPDVAELLLAFEDRCTATVHLDFFQAPRRRQLEIIGTSGTIIVQFGSWEHCIVSCGTRGSDSWEHVQLDTDRNDMFRDESRHFLQAIAGGSPVQCGISGARKSLEVIQEAYLTQKK